MDRGGAFNSPNIALEDLPLVWKKRAKSYRKTICKRRIINIATFMIIVCIVFIIAVLATHARETSNSFQHPPMVVTKCGPVQGLTEHIGKSSAHVFKGIPYAMPPIGKQRWKPPQKVEPDSCWRKILKADIFRSPCYQFHRGKDIGCEDCLYINIWKPKNVVSKSLPVMVLINGGHLTVGSSHMLGSTPNAEFVESMNIVVVSVSYRLNAFGFMALDVLSKHSKTNTSGNYGLMDQIMALEWIQQNIHFFGGNASNVIIAGHGSGATSIYALLASKKAAGLFSRAIAMSGSAVFSKTSKEASKDNEVFLNNSKCNMNSDKDTLECLYKLSASEVLHAAPWLVYPNWAMRDLNDLPKKGLFDGALCVVDGDVVVTPPGELERAAYMPDNVTVMIGNTAQEIAFDPGQNFTGKSLDEFIDFVAERLGPFSAELPRRAIDLYIAKLNSTDPQLLYTTMASDIRAVCPNNVLSLNFSSVDGMTVYRYVVTNMPSNLARFASKPTQYSADMWDQSALFGFSDLPLKYNPSQRDLKFKDTLRKVFLEFFKTGKPGIDAWTAYPSRVGLFGNESLTVEKEYHKTMCKMWNDHNMFKYGWIN